MKMKVKLGTLLVILIILLGLYFYNRNTATNSPLPLADRPTVEQYFIEPMRVSPEEAKTMASSGVDLRVSDKTTMAGITGNLYYYSFIDDERSFTKLLESTKDTTPGKETSIKVGNNTIDINSNYYLNYSMSDAEIADALLNQSRYDENFNRYTYLFMPSGNDGPSIRPEK